MNNAGFTFEQETHTYKRGGKVIPSVTQILAAGGKCSWEYVNEESRLHSLKRGQAVHWLTQLDDEGALNYRTVPIRLRGYRKAYRDWKRNSAFHVDWIEHRFTSHYGFAGTLDRTGWFPATTDYERGTSAVVDLKTGPIIAGHVRLQLAAYSLAVDQRPAIARTIRRIALRLSADGRYQVKEFPMSEYDSDLAQFMECLKNVSRGEVVSRGSGEVRSAQAWLG